MSSTRTGSFPIGFRHAGPKLRPMGLDGAIAFARDSGFEALDLSSGTPAEVKQLLDRGLKIGTFDLPEPWGKLCSADGRVRNDTASQMADQIAALAEAGASKFFCVMLPEDNAAPRADNLKLAAEGYGRLCELIGKLNVQILLEGWPGPAPHFPALGCTPADLRLIFDAINSPVMGVNYDPSHLVRMGIDPLRFIHEFAPRIGHVHAKDTELMTDARYDHGSLQPATQTKPHICGGHVWRYAIPGHGCVPWTRLFNALVDAGYDGIVSIELEDEQFWADEQAAQRGLLASRDFLIHA